MRLIAEKGESNNKKKWSILFLKAVGAHKTKKQKANMKHPKAT
jgi:hypothetical protein